MDIALFTSCPKSPKCSQMMPKGLPNESRGRPKCYKVEPSGPLTVLRCAPNASKCQKKLPWETSWNTRWTQCGPSVFQRTMLECFFLIWDAFWLNFERRCSVWGSALGMDDKQNSRKKLATNQQKTSQREAKDNSRTRLPQAKDKRSKSLHLILQILLNRN